MKHKKRNKRNVPMLITASAIACSFFLVLVMIGFECQKSIIHQFYL
ncbi:hypothetical protein K1Y82_15015 [Bacillus inaquosorum]|nr:hypothetical protein [Bacillus inaquosorum]QYX42510.1 hypothetical protein K1Y82_15015 [Bacillus inaquosorum]WNW23362.1 hypothetical protein RS399_16835 [Bacillus inaquosorum]